MGEAEGSAIVAFGPIGGGEPGSVSISNSTFDQNQAVAGNGGNSGPGAVIPASMKVIASSPICATLNVASSSFSHNKSIGGNNATATGTDIVEAGVAEGAPSAMSLAAASRWIQQLQRQPGHRREQ